MALLSPRRHLSANSIVSDNSNTVQCKYTALKSDMDNTDEKEWQTFENLSLERLDSKNEDVEKEIESTFISNSDSTKQLRSKLTLNLDFPFRPNSSFKMPGKLRLPFLTNNLKYHAFFIYDDNDRDWVLSVINKLEACNLRCCSSERDLDPAEPYSGDVIENGMKKSLRTVVVISPDFLNKTWILVERLFANNEALVVRLQKCDLPASLADFRCIDAVFEKDWWWKLVKAICTGSETPTTEQTLISGSISMLGVSSDLQTGHLLVSIKSRWRFCGRELIETDKLPEELPLNGIQIPIDEWQDVVNELMSDAKFTCHVWCYNMPLAIVTFGILLLLCLTLVPAVERLFLPKTTGLAGVEIVHGAIVWLCILTVYMVITHISRRKMKEATYKHLTQVNSTLVKYNLLAGIENLGIADCNKYYLHVFYFEFGPCLAYLQELTMAMEERSYSNRASNTECNGHDLDVEAANDRTKVLGNGQTNAAVQTQAEELMLSLSGEYINLLITKKLELPHRPRHVKNAPCLCQFVEQRIYKRIV